MTYFARFIGLLLITAALGGCATSSNPGDPLEGFNRAMFNFNDAVDRAALKPAATAYRDVLPSFVQTAIGNFFGNIGDVWTAVNNVLQGKMENGLSDFMRVVINTTLGFGGVLDIGSEAGLPKHKEDFGQTLGVWGVPSGPYVVLPLLGSSTVRDTAALPADFQGDLWTNVYPVRLRNTGTVVRVVDQRAAVLDASNLIEAAALDPYEFVRDAYLQRRESRIREEGAARPGMGNDSNVEPQAPASPQTPAEPAKKPAVQSTIDSEKAEILAISGQFSQKQEIVMSAADSPLSAPSMSSNSTDKQLNTQAE
ncbi:MAG: VacJ family lipoprotein [Pseudomonadota bacterium]